MPSSSIAKPRGLRRAAAAVALSILIHALVLVALSALPGERSPASSFPVELVLPPPAALPKRTPSLATPPSSPVRRPVRHARPAPRRLERSNSPAPGSGAAAPEPARTLFATPSAPGEGNDLPSAGSSGAPGPGSTGSTGSTESGGPRPVPRPAPATPPRTLESPPPAYPASARRRRVEGLVMVRARVGREGRVLETQLAHSSGAEDLDRSAVEAVRAWRFQPGSRGTEPVEAWVNVPVRFRLGSSH